MYIDQFQINYKTLHVCILLKSENKLLARMLHLNQHSSFVENQRAIRFIHPCIKYIFLVHSHIDETKAVVISIINYHNIKGEVNLSGYLDIS